MRCVLTASLLALATATSSALPAQEITREQRAESPWPAMTIVTFIRATPEEAAAIFTDYESHASFLPSTKLSRISRTVSPGDVEVEYVVALPIVSDERYTVRDRLSRDSAGYRVDWTLVRASSTRATTGHARFTPMLDPKTGASGTRFEYHNFVTPGSRIASLGFIRNRALKEMEQTAAALAARIESERAKPDVLRARIAALRSALASPLPTQRQAPPRGAADARGSAPATGTTQPSPRTADAQLPRD
jgi:hypothetical protein